MTKFVYYEVDCKLLNRWYISSNGILYVECRVYFGPFDLFSYKKFIPEYSLTEVVYCHA